MSVATSQRLLTLSRTCIDVAREHAWKRTAPHSVDTGGLTWPVDSEALAAIVVRWPSEYDWQYRHMWGTHLVAALQGYVKTEIVEVPQPFEAVITMELVIGGDRHLIGFDVSDYEELNEAACDGCELLFKLQFRRDGYGAQDHVLPGGFFNADPVIYRYLTRLRRLRDRMVDRYDVYGRFELTMDERRRPLEILAGSTQFSFRGGRGKLRYSRYLREIALSKVCIDLPGTASMTFRLLDYLAVGACVVGPRHACRFPIPLVDGEHVVYCADDFSDLEAKCAYYVEHEAARSRLVRNSRAFFDSYAHRDQLAAYYLQHCLKRFGSP